MSYDITLKRHALRSQRMDLHESHQDDARLAFLRALDNADFEVTEWEAKFIADVLKRFPSVAASVSFSPRQREKIDQMRGEYEHRLPGSLTARPYTAPSLPEPEKGKCGYIVRDPEKRRCGEPAVTTLTHGLELCQQHEDQRQQQIARMREWKTRNLRS